MSDETLTVSSPCSTDIEYLLDDWDAIEREYRAGVLSIREIAKRYKLSEGAIRKRAKVNHWQRDLSKRVNEAVRTQLVRTEVRTNDVRTEREIVDAAAQMVVQVVQHHRQDIAHGRELVELLFGQLSVAATKREEIEDDIVEETAEDLTRDRRNRMLRSVSLPVHATTMRDLAQALRHVVVLERQAFNVDAQPTEEPEQADELSTNIAGKILAELNVIASG